ncbi:MAG: SDR family NAD(P)-dependent oxidoreductase [Filimonas sp.]|nr:SDR family NAD(P)-dependent oxidoreductase [Filimonas sp.]
MHPTYAVVTGASQGLGKAFATALAKQGYALILVSLPGQHLGELSDQLAFDYNVKTHFFETDLSCRENVLELARQVNAQFEVSMLINNAGVGGTVRFDEASAEYVDRIIQLNVMATSLLTHQLLTNMRRQEKAYILNVSSLAAFSPIGYKTVYPASKAFVHSFSRGLYQELKDSNIFVSVVNPGPMKTNPDVTRRIEQQGFFARLTALDPATVATYCLRKLRKRDTVIIVNRGSWLLLKLLPIWIKLPMLTNSIKKELNISHEKSFSDRHYRPARQ